MRQVLQIARREFGQYTRTRGFILTLLLVPAWIVLSAVLRHMVEAPAPTRYFALYDETGRYAAAFAVPTGEPSAEAKAAQAATLPTLTVGGVARELAAPGAPYRQVALPPDLVPALHARDRTAIRPLLRGATEVPGPDGYPVSLYAIAIIPAGFSEVAPTIEYWSANQTDDRLPGMVQTAALAALRAEAVAGAGLAPALQRTLLQAEVGLKRFNPLSPAAGPYANRAYTVRRLFPCGVALLTLLAILSIASMLLMAVVEEKSSRVVEMLLAATTPRRLLAGKLLGAGLAALTMVAGWLAGSHVTASLLSVLPPGGIIPVLRESGVFGDLPLILLCAACGLAIYAAIFLGIGAMARSFQEAQSYLGPLMFLLFAPMGFISFVLTAPNGTTAKLLSLSPLHAPFFLMIRLPYLSATPGTIAAFAWMLLCTAGLFCLMAAGFAQSILPSESGAGIGQRLARLVRRGATAS
jgi:ABC-2 type transport system permease protein